jgi:hypothetical protein
MTDDDLIRMLRASLPDVSAAGPTGDLWEAVVVRAERRIRWTSADWSVAALVAVALLLFPKWFWFLAYHL